MLELPSSTPQISSEERIWAALAHATVILFGWGLFGPVLVWIMQRHKSAYAAFHALQALAYQVLITVYSIIISFGLMALFFVFVIGFGMATEFGSSNEPPLFIFAAEFLFFIALFGAYAAYILLGLIGAGLSLAGKNFRYPLLGGWVARYLGDSTLPSRSAPATEEPV
jgi:uncharacterized Tic20 family protein